MPQPRTQNTLQHQDFGDRVQHSKTREVYLSKAAGQLSISTLAAFLGTPIR